MSAQPMMSPLKTDDLHRIFEKLDKNGDGIVSLDELRWFLERIGLSSSSNHDELESLVGKTSLDLIDFLFFYNHIVNQNLEEEGEEEEEEEQSNIVESDLSKAFKVYDLNGDGYISCDELQSCLSRLGLWNEDCGRDCKRMIDVYDTNSDGLLDFEEFKNMMFPIN